MVNLAACKLKASLYVGQQVLLQAHLEDQRLPAKTPCQVLLTSWQKKKYRPQAAELGIGKNHKVAGRTLLLVVVVVVLLLFLVVQNANPQVLVEQEPLAGIGEDSGGVGVPLDPDILHVVVEQLQPSKVLELPRLLDILVRQEVLNL